MAEEKKQKGTFKEQTEKTLKMYEESKHSLDEKMQSSAAQDEETKGASPRKLKQVSSRITLTILKKQINLLNKEITEGNLLRARSRKMVIDNLVSALKGS